MTNTSIFLSLSEDFVTSYLTIGKGASPNTIKSYKYAFRLLIEFMYSIKNTPADKIRFSDLDYNVLSAFFDWLVNVRGCSISTRNQRLAALLSFSEYAQNRNFEAASVFRSSLIKIPVKKAKQESPSWFDADEMQIILRLPDDSTSIGLRDKVLLCIMYATGARAQEICDLTVSNVRFSDKGATIDIIGKGNKCRRIRISSHSAGILKKYIIHKGIEHSPNRHIFSSQTHEHMTISCIEELVKKYVFKAKALHPDKFIKSRYSPHSIRHTTAVHMLESGVPLMVIKNFLGHSSIQTTQVYAELTQNTVDKHIQQWNEKWFPHEINPESIRPRPDRMPDFLRP